MNRVGNRVTLVLLATVVFGARAFAQEFVPGEVIVKLKPGASLSVLSRVSTPGALNSAAVSRSTGALLVRLSDGVAVASAVTLLKRDAAVEYAEPNWIQVASAVPDDPQQGSQWAWGVIRAYDAWDLETGKPSIAVNVIDTGIDTDHPDLAGNIWTNALEASGTAGADDDGNGYVDDIHGWNSILDNGNPEDDNNHGTHVSGTIGAVTHNGVGVAGVNWAVSIVPCKFLNAVGSGSSFDAIQCIDYVIATRNNAASNADIRVSSNSWGGGGFSQALKDAIQAATQSGILWVSAAGNEASNNDCLSSGAYSASYNVPGILAVASTSSSDVLYGTSNFGPSTVDIGAPGASILSTVADGGYGSYTGTSMACPHVAGVAALVLARNPGLSLTQVEEAILCNGDPIPSLEGATRTGMRLSALGAVAAASGGSTCNDRDGDGVPDYADNCPYVANDQADNDGDGVGNGCEPLDCGGCL